MFPGNSIKIMFVLVGIYCHFASMVHLNAFLAIIGEVFLTQSGIEGCHSYYYAPASVKLLICH